MAAFKGKEGSIVVNGDPAVLLNSWSITFNNAIAEDTSFGEDFSSYEYTIQSATATVSGCLNVDSTGSEQLILAGETALKIAVLELYIDATKKYTGVAMISSFTVTAQVGNLIQATFNITWDGGCVRS